MSNPLAETGKALAGVLPAYGSIERVVALALYRLLALGEPVPIARLAGAVGLLEAEVEITLDPGLVFRNEEGHVVGFGGLTPEPMANRMQVGGRTLYGWCALDTLFLPRILAATAEVFSVCPVTGEEIHLVVSRERIERAEPSNAVMSILLPDREEFRSDVLTSFCHHVHFFRSADVGSEWIAERPEHRIVSLQDAFRLGRFLTTAVFGDLLGSVGTGGRVDPLPADVELVYDSDCPNVGRARTALRDALAMAGPDGWRERVQKAGADEEMARHPPGTRLSSPTILIDGWDPFPSGPGDAPGCRLYANGAPAVHRLVTALEAARRRRRALAELER